MARKPTPDELRKLKDKAAEAAAKGKLEKAADLYREAADGDPRDIASRQKLAEVLRRDGRIPEAIEAYRAVADRFGKDGLLIKAIAISKTILELDPQHVETQTALAELYAKKAQAEGNRPPPRTMMVAAMKAAGAAPPRPPPRPGTQDSVVAIPLVPSPETNPDAIEIDLDAEVPLDAGNLPPELVPLDEGNLPPELVGTFPPPVPPPPEPARPPVIATPPAPPAPPPAPSRSAAHIRGAPPPVHRQAGFEAPVPARPSPPAAPGAPMFAQIMSAAERAVEAGIEEDLLVRADPVDAEILGDEPLEPVVEVPAAKQPARATAPAAPRPAQAPAPAPAAPGLPRIPIFSDLDRAAFVELMQGMVLHRVASGSSVLHEGEDGTSFYVVASGKLAVSKRDPAQGGSIVLAHLASGEFFGEMALLAGTTRSATVTAEEEAEVLEFRADVLLDIAGRHPHVAQSLRRFYRQRLLANALAVSPIFRPFQRGERKLIMERFRAREVGEGEVIIRDGQPSDGLYVVLEGAVDVVKRKDAQEVVVGHLREGDLFGEMSCLRKAPASATIVVRRPGTLLRLPRKEFDELVVTYPQILELVSTLSEERAESLDAILSGHAEWTDEGLVLT
jgi:CRP-like cAMP-binding protein